MNSYMKRFKRLAPVAAVAPGMVAAVLAECSLEVSMSTTVGNGFSASCSQDTEYRAAQATFYRTSGAVCTGVNYEDDCVNGVVAFNAYGPQWTTSLQRYISRSATNYDYINSTVAAGGEGGGYAIAYWE